MKTLLLWLVTVPGLTEVTTYEETTPGLVESTAHRILTESRDNWSEHVGVAAHAPAEGVQSGTRQALDGDGSGMFPGWRNGMADAGLSGLAGAGRWADAFRLVPERLHLTAADASATGQELAQHPRDAWQVSADGWVNVRNTHVREARELEEAWAALGLDAQAWRSAMWQETDRSLHGEQDQAAARLAGISSWTTDNWNSGLHGLTVDVPQTWQNGRRATDETAAFWKDRSVYAFHAPGRWSAQMWSVTRESGAGAWSATPTEAQRTFLDSTHKARAVAEWMGEHRNQPLRLLPEMMGQVNAYNYREGWERGVKAGFKSAGDAWDAGDVSMGVLWVGAALGKGALHLGAEGLMVPTLAVSSVATTVALWSTGYSLAAALGARGVLLYGLTFTAGTASSGALWAFGTGATLVSAGAGVVHGAATAVAGLGVTSLVAAGGAALTAGEAGGRTAQLVVTPLLGAGGAVASQTWHLTQRTSLWGLGFAQHAASRSFELGAKAVRVVPLVATDAVATASAAATTGVEYGVKLPIHGVMSVGGHAVRTTVRFAEDPVAGTGLLFNSAGLAVHTAGSSAVALVTHAVGGVAVGAGNAVMGGGDAVMVGVGAAGVGVDFGAHAVNVPQHREWAQQRTLEIEESLSRIKGGSIPEAGELILVRVHWWGDDTGRVRFFVTRNPTTGQRWFFERSVNPDTCEVVYRATKKDPVTRAWSRADWTEPMPTGMLHRECVEAHQPDPVASVEPSPGFAGGPAQPTSPVPGEAPGNGKGEDLLATVQR